MKPTGSNGKQKLLSLGGPIYLSTQRDDRNIWCHFHMLECQTESETKGPFRGESHAVIMQPKQRVWPFANLQMVCIHKESANRCNIDTAILW